MKVTTTPHGFQSVQFTDEAGKIGIAEQCGGVDYANPTADQPGRSYLLLGRQDAPVQLNMEQVAELVGYLQKWLVGPLPPALRSFRACGEAGLLAGLWIETEYHFPSQARNKTILLQPGLRLFF